MSGNMKLHLLAGVLAVLLLEVTSDISQGVIVNLALRRSTGASSIVSSAHKSWKGNDGNVNNQDYEQHFASMSDDPDPYWYVMLEDFYLVQTVEVVRRMHCCPQDMETIEVRVGKSLNDDFGKANPLCGEPTDMRDTPTFIFRCELYGKYVTVKKTLPFSKHLVFPEVMVNKEPTSNLAFRKPVHSTVFPVSSPPSNLVDGIIASTSKYFGKRNAPQWIMIDLEASMDLARIFVFLNPERLKYLKKVVMTLGDDSSDNGKNNERIGDVHDLSRKLATSVYVHPRMKGRYFYLEALECSQFSFFEIQLFSEALPFITLRSNGFANEHRTFYEGHGAALECQAHGFPVPRVSLSKDGELLEDKNSFLRSLWTVNDTKGSTFLYECNATNSHGKDYYPITVNIEGRYAMCIKPEEIKDATRSIHSKGNASGELQSDHSTFQSDRMYKFFNPQSGLYMKIATSCPSPSSCGTGAPGWMVGKPPQPEDGITRKKICFHYNGDCCYKSIIVTVINCPGIYVYGLVNTANLGFPARYCFEDDKKFEAFAPFKSVPTLFAPVGGNDVALTNHVIAKEDGIEDAGQCMIVCMMNKCRSYNFAKLDKICEVNDVTKEDYPRHLSSKTGFQYYHPMSQPVVVKRGNN